MITDFNFRVQSVESEAPLEWREAVAGIKVV